MEEAKGQGSTKECTSLIQMASCHTQSHVPPHAHSGDNEIEAGLRKFSQLVSDRLKPCCDISSVGAAMPLPAGHFVIPTELTQRARGH